MTDFEWTGKKGGIVVRGNLSASNLDEAIAELKARGIETDEWE